MLDVARRPAAASAWPITQAAHDALEAEIRSIEAELARTGHEPLRGVHADVDGQTRVDLGRTVRRLEHLQALCDEVRVDAGAGIAVIGRRVGILDEDGSTATYALVLPGDGDPSRGWLSIDSPVGLAVVGRGAGERAVVRAPGGDWEIAIVAVE